MKQLLFSKKVAILAADGFEQSELDQIRMALEDAGALTEIVSPAKCLIHGNNGVPCQVDVALEDADPADYEALLLAGGRITPGPFGQMPAAAAFAHAFFEDDKPVAALDRSPQWLVAAEVLRGRTVTSDPSLKFELTRAGACWVDWEVVVDNGLVTGRPEALPEFNATVIGEIAGGAHHGHRRLVAV